MLPLTSNQTEIEQLTVMCDGFLFTGGHDVSPSVYQSHTSEKCGECCIQRDEMETAHHQLPPYDVPCHGVKIMEDSQLYDLLKADTIMVNSYHHQAIKKLAPGIVPMAVSEDGLVEAILVQEKSFIWASPVLFGDILDGEYMECVTSGYQKTEMAVIITVYFFVKIAVN